MMTIAFNIMEVCDHLSKNIFGRLEAIGGTPE
jgi:hypothetical protein